MNAPREVSVAARPWLVQAAEALATARRLVELQSSLIADDAATVSSDDIDVLVPWNIAGRYPTDLGDPGPETAASAVDAAGRIVDALSRRVLPDG